MMHARVLSYLLLPALLLSAPADASAGSSDEVLVEVNGAPITGADLEALIVEYHRTAAMSAESGEGLVPRLLEKAIRDELLLQDAFAMGMGEDPDITEPIRRNAIKRAISGYAREHVGSPEITDAQVNGFFDAYYHKVKIRQLSTSTPEECLDALQRIRSGEVTMGALATQISLDPRGPRGGLHNDLHWADVDTMLRGASEGLDVGEFSPPFRYGALWSVIRIESRTPPDPAELPSYEPFIRRVLREEARAEAWESFVAGQRDAVRIELDEAVLARVVEDRDALYRGDFRQGSADALMWIDAERAVSERWFREAMSDLAMGMGETGFEEILEATRTDQEEFLALWHAAAEAGWLERPEITAFHETELEQAVLTTYLDENIGRKIRFDREEYEAFYREHAEEFRGPEQVRLSFLIADDEATIRGAARRLSDGADFDYVRAEIEGRDPQSSSGSRWSELSGFNENVIAAVSGLETGGTSDPVPYNDRWMILRLDGRRPGEIPPIDAVDGAIREALYYREFSALLDTHLARLSDASVIVRHEDRIRAWAEKES